VDCQWYLNIIDDILIIKGRKDMSEDRTIELVVQELQNRIGQITSEYETRLALLKAQATQELQQKDAQIQELLTPQNPEDKKY
jgi:hypothetical protein